MTCPCANKLEEFLESELERAQKLEWVRGAAERASGLDWVRGLVGLPRGFYQTDGGFTCDDSSPAYVRGILLPTAQYNAMPLDQRLALQNADVYPRWRLFGGPFTQKSVADAWDQYLYFAAFDSGQTWISHGVVCIVPPYALAWPADSSVQWSWVNETQAAPQAQKQYDAKSGTNQIAWV